EDITEVMETDFPTVNALTHLEDIFHLYRDGLPVAVVDTDGTFKGMVEQSDLIASIGKPQKLVQDNS
ncbi:MAG: CBS domain-containing protein, partial [Moorea sp. SIO4G2]|nr:CBS domain-containing protein [Moorena sp. SIO4G2]